MRKHQFIKVDCMCQKRASNYICRYCGAMEYAGVRELRHLPQMRARCDSPDAPECSQQERFKSMFGGTFDCLAPDHDSHAKKQ